MVILSYRFKNCTQEKDKQNGKNKCKSNIKFFCDKILYLKLEQITKQTILFVKQLFMSFPIQDINSDFFPYKINLKIFFSQQSEIQQRLFTYLWFSWQIKIKINSIKNRQIRYFVNFIGWELNWLKCFH